MTALYLCLTLTISTRPRYHRRQKMLSKKRFQIVKCGSGKQYLTKVILLVAIELDRLTFYK